MQQQSSLNQYLDLKNGQKDETEFFFLENILKARIALNMETGLHDYDEELNLYIAYLLMSILTADTALKMRPYISPYDTDIQQYLEDHPGIRTQYRVYRENADFGLVSESVFLGYEHSGSYFKRVLADTEAGGRIALYYEQAASALAHLVCTNTVLVQVLFSLAKNYSDILKLLRKVAGEYFDFIEHLSQGSIYHLEKEITNMGIKSAYDRRLDSFLKAYFDYSANPTEKGREEVHRIVAELKKLNENFSFDESKLTKHLYMQ